MMDIHFSTLLVKLVITIQDLYISLYAAFKTFIQSCLFAYCALITKLSPTEFRNGTILVNATALLDRDCIDVTYALYYFYKYDNLGTCSSLYRWLNKYGVNTDTIDITFYRVTSTTPSVTYRLDLAKCMELYTKSELDEIWPDNLIKLSTQETNKVN